jgi:hypothetical protein
VIDAESGVRARAQEVRIAVRSGQGDESAWEERYENTLDVDDNTGWPVELSLLPKDGDATRVYEVTATALDAGGAPIAIVRAISGYVQRRALRLSLTFEDDCIDKALTCTDTQTCVSGACVDARITSSGLPGYSSPSTGANDRDSGSAAATDGGANDAAAAEAAVGGNDSRVPPSDADAAMDGSGSASCSGATGTDTDDDGVQDCVDECLTPIRRRLRVARARRSDA